MNGPNKLVTMVQKACQGQTLQLLSLINKLQEKKFVNTAPGLYSQHFIFVIAHEWAQYTRAFHYTGTEGLPMTNTLASLAHS